MALNLKQLKCLQKQRRVFILLTLISILLSCSSNLFASNKIYDHRNPDDVTALLKDGLDGQVDPDYEMDDGTTALMIAAYLGNIKKIEALLKNGADINKARNDGQTSIDFAIANNNNKAIELLRAHGAIINRDQKTIKFFLGLYLEKFYPSQNKSFLEKFKNADGHCNGLTSLWLYSKWLDTQPQKPNGYNKGWFNNVLEDIISWDGKTKPTSEVSKNFETFSHLMDFFQDPTFYYPQTPPYELDNLIHLAEIYFNKNLFKKAYSIVSSFTKQQLYDILENTVYDNKFVSIHYACSAGYHSAGLLKFGGNYYYYDPNDKNGEVEVATIEKVANIIINASNHYNNKNDKNKVNNRSCPIGFIIYDPNKEEHQYPNQADFLNEYVDSAKGEELILSALIGSIESIEFFLAKGIPVDFAGKDDNTALIIAVQNGYLNVAKLLLEKGASVNFVNKFGKTALMYASDRRGIDMVKLLVEKMTTEEINLADNRGETALTKAVLCGDLEIIKILLKNGAHTNILNNNNETILMAALMEPNANIISALIKNGASATVNQANNNGGYTAIMMAAAEGWIDIAALLLRSGANPYIKNYQGQNAIDIAHLYGHRNCAEILANKENKIDEL